MKKNHDAVKRKIRVLGITLLVIGAILDIIGLISFGMAFGGNGTPDLFFLNMIGMPLLAIGIFLTVFSFRREIAQYTKDETVPVAKDLYQDVRPEIKDFASIIRGKNKDTDKVICPACGGENDFDHKFCVHCGKELFIACPRCGGSVDVTDKFCPQCGEKLRD